MIGATTLVEWVGANLREIMPFRIVRTYQRGVRFRGGSVTMQNLADLHGVSVAQISRIVNGKQWLSKVA